jgi:glycosyltransferase involved in cell wall biosynthesis
VGSDREDRCDSDGAEGRSGNRARSRICKLKSITNASGSGDPVLVSLNTASRIRLGIVTNIPAPYRIPIFNLLAVDPAIDLHVFYAAKREPDRNWDLPEISHPHSFLQEAVFRRRNGRFLHNNPDIFTALREFNPRVVLTTGFNPTHLYAFAYSQLCRRRHVAMTDGTPISEAELSWLHRLVRQMVIRRSGSFVVASNGGRALYRSYGAPEDKICFSPLCANTSVSWHGVAPCIPNLDFLFSGRLVDVKNPLFALQVAHGVAKRIGRRTSVAVLGAGPLEAELRIRAAELAECVDIHLVGNVRQADVPRWLAGARVFLFPTSWDPWGVVANEACLAGVPVIVSPHAGAAGELIIDGVNGYVRPLELPQWIDAAVRLISNPSLCAKFSDQARLQVQAYSFENAARGIADAVRMAVR